MLELIVCAGALVCPNPDRSRPGPVGVCSNPDRSRPGPVRVCPNPDRSRDWPDHIPSMQCLSRHRASQGGNGVAGRDQRPHNPSDEQRGLGASRSESVRIQPRLAHRATAAVVADPVPHGRDSRRGSSQVQEPNAMDIHAGAPGPGAAAWRARAGHRGPPRLSAQRPDRRGPPAAWF